MCMVSFKLFNLKNFRGNKLVAFARRVECISVRRVRFMVGALMTTGGWVGLLGIKNISIHFFSTNIYFGEGYYGGRVDGGSWK